MIKDVFEFMETNFRIRDNKGQRHDFVLESFQKEFFEKGPLFGHWEGRLTNKSRKLGYSMLDGMESLIMAKAYSNSFFPVIATTEDQANHYIKLCSETIKDSRLNFLSIIHQGNWRLLFDNGSEIRTYSGSNPASVRGPKAIKLTLDEFAHSIYQEELLRAATPMLMGGGFKSIMSTPLGINNMFWKMYKSPGKMQIITQPLFSNVKELNSHISLLEQPHLKCVASWADLNIVEQDRFIDEIGFLQEYCCLPAESSYALFKKEYISNAIIEDKAFNYANTDLMFAPEIITSNNSWFEGCDFALSAADGADESAWVTGVWNESEQRAEIRKLRREKGMETPTQVKELENDYKLFSPITLMVEENSFGKAIFQYLQKTVPVVMPFTTTRQSKTEIVRLMQEWLANNKLKVFGGNTIDEKKEVAEWKDQMMAFSKIENRTETNYEMKGAGKHDDYVMATGFFIKAISDFLTTGSAFAIGSAKTFNKSESIGETKHVFQSTRKEKIYV